jgi:arylsulfatase A-like enzyme
MTRIPISHVAPSLSAGHLDKLAEQQPDDSGPKLGLSLLDSHQPQPPIRRFGARSRALLLAWMPAICMILAVLAQPLFAADRPNLLLIVTDDQGYWDTGVSGNTKIDTPVMDRLAAEGVTLDRFYAAPVCAPTRAGLMTGRYSLRTGLYNTRFGGDSLGVGEITLAEHLRKAGYRTGLFGKWHLGQYAGYQPQHRGFDEFFGHYHGHIERYSHPDQLVHNGRPVEARGYVADLFTDAARDFIAAGEQPFFCYLAYNTPHSPFLLDTTHFGQPEGDKLIEKYLARGLPLREARIYGMVERIDQNLGRLLEALDDRELTDKTLVCFMSDNGGVSIGYAAGLRGRKAGVYEGGVRVPFFARWPGRLPAGVKLNAQTSHIDIFPTLCELAGVSLPDDRTIDGRSLVPLLTSGREQSHHPFVYHTWDRFTPNAERRWAVSDGTWKLLCQVGQQAEGGPKHWQLYNLENDPGENRNVIDKHPEVAERLREEFVRWFTEVTQGQIYRPVAIPVGHPDEPIVEIQPSWAELHGESIHYTFDGYDWDTIEGWSHPGEKATWKLDVLRAGRFEVLLSYGCSHETAGGRLRITIGDSMHEVTPRATATRDVFITESAGTVILPQGPATLTAKAVQINGGELMRLNAIRLRSLAEPAAERKE